MITSFTQKQQKNNLVAFYTQKWGAIIEGITYLVSRNSRTLDYSLECQLLLQLEGILTTGQSQLLPQLEGISTTRQSQLLNIIRSKQPHQVVWLAMLATYTMMSTYLVLTTSLYQVSMTLYSGRSSGAYLYITPSSSNSE